MNKILFPIFLVVIISSCNSSEEKKEKSTVAEDTLSKVLDVRDTITFTIEPIDENYYCKQTKGMGYCLGPKDKPMTFEQDSVMIVKLMENHKDIIFRKGDELIVKAKTGDLKFKSNVNTDGDDYLQYQLREVNGVFVTLMVLYYESFEYMIINLETGKSFKTWGRPVFNKEKNMAIAGNYDLVAQFTTNGIQLFGQDENGWDLKMQKYLDDWGPEDMFWLNDSVILSKKNVLDETDSIDGTRTEFVKIMLKKEKVN